MRRTPRRRSGFDVDRDGVHEDAPRLGGRNCPSVDATGLIEPFGAWCRVARSRRAAPGSQSAPEPTLGLKIAVARRASSDWWEKSRCLTGGVRARRPCPVISTFPSSANGRRRSFRSTIISNRFARDEMSFSGTAATTSATHRADLGTPASAFVPRPHGSQDRAEPRQPQGEASQRASSGKPKNIGAVRYDRTGAAASHAGVRIGLCAELANPGAEFYSHRD